MTRKDSGKLFCSTPRAARPASLLFWAALLSVPLFGVSGCQGPDDASDDSDPAASCAGGSEKSLVLTRIAFARQMPMGVSVGFQLIDHIAMEGDSETCGHGSLTDPEGRKGINNQLSVLMPAVDAVTNGAADPLVQEAINGGMLLYGVRIPNLQGQAQGDASCVNLEFRMLGGKPNVGTDQRLDPNQTFDTQPGLPISTVRGVMKAGVIEAGPFELTMPIRILDAQFNQVLRGTRVRITLHEDGSASGVIGGGITKSELIDNIKPLGIGMVKDLLPTLLDSIADLEPESTSHDCRQFSGAFSFDAKNAFINP
jgi:hypothetical protein